MIKWVAAIGCVCSGGLVTPAGALVLTLDHAAFLGELEGNKGAKNKEELYINQLAGMTPGSTDGLKGLTYLRSGNLFSALPKADFGRKVNNDHTGIILDGSYAYLLARYGSSTFIWSVAGLVASYDLPASFEGGGGIAHYSLFRGINLAGVKR